SCRGPSGRSRIGSLISGRIATALGGSGLGERRMSIARHTFGWEQLDRDLGGGLLPGTLTVVAGATGVGKTQLGLRWAHAALRGGLLLPAFRARVPPGRLRRARAGRAVQRIHPVRIL